mmetsp:Transcript_16327/g.29484  ORF Transcript_16327/g.29484 Transcript_16327/m.29484 type:complete len:133 (-) Transcript_16327:34-432(-)
MCGDTKEKLSNDDTDDTRDMILSILELLRLRFSTRVDFCSTLFSSSAPSKWSDSFIASAASNKKSSTGCFEEKGVFDFVHYHLRSPANRFQQLLRRKDFPPDSPSQSEQSKMLLTRSADPAVLRCTVALSQH